MKPLYKRYKSQDDFDIKDISNNDGQKCLLYQHIKTINYVDFEGNWMENKEIVDKGSFSLYSIYPEIIIVKREKDDITKMPRTWLYCKYLEYFVIYIEIKI